MPWLWLIAGPNGSGKSTIVDDNFLEELTGQSFRKLNADVRTLELVGQSPKLQLADANLLAATQIDSEVDQLISEGVSFAVETVLSSDKYKSRVEKARERGFNVGLVYVTLATPEDCIDRVKLRVQQSGHDVPPEKIRTRWERSLSNLPWFASQADVVLVFDNTAPANTKDSPVLLASKLLGGKLRLLRRGHHPRVDAELALLIGDKE